MSKKLKIISFEAQNTRVLKHVKIDPDGNVVVLGGDNGAGKSTVLDTIALTLGGGEQPVRPIREGQNSGRAQIKLGERFGADPEFVATRIWDAKGSRIELRGADGKTVGSPQTLLKKMCSAVAFNPLAFADEKDKRKQGEILRKLVGLDFADVDTEIASLYDRRTDIGRDGKTAAGQLAGISAPSEGTPDEEVSIKDLLAEKESAEKTHADADKAKQAHADAQAKVDAVQAEIERLEKVIKGLHEQVRPLVDVERELDDAADAANEKRVDIAPIREKLASAEDINRAVRAKKEHNKKSAEVKRLRDEYAGLTEKIEALEAKKTAALASADWPVPGLGFDSEGGVTYNGLPYAQASKAERYRISVAIGARISGDLRVMLIPDASLYDKKSMALLAQIAQEHDMMMWVERVGDGDAGAIVLEDGEIKAAE